MANGCLSDIALVYELVYEHGWIGLYHMLRQQR